ncbi:MAG: hypothetical protein VB855_19095 [Pirellulaceae bacterium]|tara:strand:- start:1274 stop:1642 length:369 start_codon:yes stop_codon:yes gene_type:complete
MIVIVYLLTISISILLGSLAFAVVLWMNDTTATFSDLKKNLKLCLIYNVIMEVFSLAANGLYEVAPPLGIVVGIVGLILSFKLLMEWFDLSFFGVLWLSLVAYFVLIVSLVVVSGFLIGVLM